MTDPSIPSKPPLRILVLDSGGLQATSTLTILNEILERKAEKEGKPKDQKRKPCEVFDIIAGIGVGGWLAILLGRFQMDITGCLSEWFDMMQFISTKPRTPGFHLPVLQRCWFDKKRLEQRIQELADVYLIRHDTKPARTRHVLVAALTSDAKGYEVFRFYETPTSAKLPEKPLQNPTLPYSHEISTAFTVTGASKYFSKHWKAQTASRGDTGSSKTVNPNPYNITALILDEVRDLYGTQVPLSTVLNIGPGQSHKATVKTRLGSLQDITAADIEKKFNSMHPWNAETYHYLAPSGVLHDDPEMDISDHDKLMQATNDFLSDPRADTSIDAIVKQMLGDGSNH